MAPTASVPVQEAPLAPWASAAAANLDPAPLNLLREELQRLSDKNGLPGYSLCVSRHGRRAFQAHKGPSPALEASQTKVDEHSLFRLLGMSSSVLAVALMTYFDEGRFQLDDPISKFLGDAWRAEVGDNEAASGLRVARSNGVVRGAAGEDPDEQVVGPRDAAFLFCPSAGSHVDADFEGTCRCREERNGKQQTFRMEPLAAGYVAVKAHNGLYWDVEDGIVVAKSQSPVAWMYRVTPSHTISSSPTRIISTTSVASAAGSLVSTPSTNSLTNELVAGTALRLRHQGTCTWAQLVTDAEDDEDVGLLATTADVADGTLFILEKQTFQIHGVEEALQDITIRNLLTHTSGLDASGQEETPIGALDALLRPLVQQCESAQVKNLAQWVGELAKAPLRRQPGTAFEEGYSSDVIARLLEVLGEAPLEEVVRRRVLDPLQMHSTHFEGQPEVLATKLGDLYDLAEDGTVSLLSRSEVYNNRTFTFPCGGGDRGLSGGLVTSTSDFMRFCNMLLGKGRLQNAQLLKESTVAMMTEVNHLAVVLGNPSATLKAGEVRGFNLLGGLELQMPGTVDMDDPEFNPGMYGWSGKASTLYRVDPTSGVCVVFMANCVGLDAQVERLILRRVGEAIHNGCRVGAFQAVKDFVVGATRPSAEVASTAVATAAVFSVLLAAGMAGRKRSSSGSSIC